MSDAAPKPEASFIAPLSTKFLREKLLGAKPVFRQVKVAVDVGGESIEVIAREPTRGEQAQIFKAGGMKSRAGSEGGEVEFANPDALMLWATLLCTYGADGQRLFQNADAEALSAMPGSDKLVPRIGSAVMSLLREANAAGETSASTP